MSDLPAYVIIGASGGIATAVCQRLAKTGSRLLLVGRNEDKLQALATALRQSNPTGQYEVFVADATKSAEIDAAFAKATELAVTVEAIADQPRPAARWSASANGRPVRKIAAIGSSAGVNARR